MDSSVLWMQAVGILALILINAFFSASEIAILTLRQTRIPQLVETGRRGAKRLAELRAQPAGFLATIQVGMTLVGSMASAIGGAIAIGVLEPALRQSRTGLPPDWSTAVALLATVGVISYLTLVIGELTPKSLALRHTETLACSSAPVVHALSKLALPVVWTLTASTNAVLWLFRSANPSTNPNVSEEEVKFMVREGTDQGVFDAAEQELIHSVFEFTDTSVREVMVSRSDILAVEVGTAPNEVVEQLLKTGFSRAPVYKRDLERIVGVVHIKDLVGSMRAKATSALSEIMHPAFFVPDSMQISDLLRELQSRRTHLAVVLNEFGTLIGLVTIEDLLEEIVGEIRDEFDVDEELPVQKLPDGSLLADGSTPLNDLREKYGLPLEETADYRTLAGFILAQMKRIPKGGEALTHGGYKMTTVHADGRRVRKVRIERVRNDPEAKRGGEN